MLAFWVNAKLNKYHRPTPALIAAIALILTAAGAVQAALSQVLPNVAITKASFQTMPAPAAYFKNIVLYFLPLALVFMILPFHIVQVLQASRSRQAASNQTETAVALDLAMVFLRARPCARQPLVRRIDARTSYLYFHSVGVWPRCSVLRCGNRMRTVVSSHLRAVPGDESARSLAVDLARFVQYSTVNWCVPVPRGPANSQPPNSLVLHRDLNQDSCGPSKWSPINLL